MSEQNALVPVGQMDVREIMTIGKTMADSGFFTDARDASKAVVKILAGREMGFGPFASMTGISIIQGKPSVGANLMAAAVKNNPRYDYRIVYLEDNGCELAFFERGQELGRSAFTEENATAAALTGKDNWKKYPRNMYFARALSNGVRWYCPDVFNGNAVYTPDELGAEVNEDGTVIDLRPTVTQPPKSTKETGNGEDKPTNGNSRETGVMLSATAMKAILEQKLAKNAQNAGHMVNLSTILTNKSTDAEIIAWASIYREARETMDSKEAAKHADTQTALEVQAEAEGVDNG